MGLEIYRNEDELVNTTSPLRGQLFTDDELAIIQPVQAWNNISPDQVLPYGDGGATDPYTLEFHIYTLNGQWITGNYDAESSMVSYGTAVGQAMAADNVHGSGMLGQLFAGLPYAVAFGTATTLNIKALFDDSRIERGQFKFVINNFRNRIGAYDNRALFVKEISPDRTEVRLNFKDFKAIRNAWQDWIDPLSPGPYTDNAALFDQYHQFAKWQVEYTYGAKNPTGIPTGNPPVLYDLDTRNTNGGVVYGANGIGTSPYSPPDAFDETSANAGRGILQGDNNPNISSFAYMALNFGENKVYRFTNCWIDYDEYDDDNNDIFVKLYEPLSNDIDVNQDLWIVSQLMNPYVDNILVEGKAPELKLNTLTPNFNIDVNTNTITETEFKTWNDILATNTSTTQQILDKMFSGSLASGIDLGIDFTDYKNYIHFSSAKERLANFKYKVELIEYYTSQSAYLQNSVSGSSSGSKQNNITLQEERRDNVIGGFDQFERWLYNEPTASLFTHGVSGSLTPWPKYLVSGSYVLYPSTASIVTTWYTGNQTSASLYDLNNDNALTKTIPEFIRDDVNNNQYELFVNMIAQHFDILYTYVNQLTSVYSKEEHPSLGVSKDLLYNIAQSMGWHLSNGNQAKQLWQYALGVNVSGSYQSTGSLFSKSSDDITKEVWRRIINNLPYILKTKGTARSIHALMSTYGVPKTLLSIREYGGPKKESITPDILKDQFTYALRIESGSRIEIPRSTVDVSLASDGAGSILGGDRVPDTIEFRFKPKSGSAKSYINAWQTNTKPLLSYVKGFGSPASSIGWSLGLQHTASYSGSSDYGRLVFAWHSGSSAAGNAQYYVSSSTEYVPLFDGDWWNVRLWTNIPFTSSAFSSSADPNIYFQTQRSADCSNCKILHNTSASLNIYDVYAGATASQAISDIWNRSADDSKLFLGGHTGSITGGAGVAMPYKSMFTGAFQEYREYMEVLSDDVFNTHTLNPTSYVGNNPTSSYYTLVRHYPLGTDVKAKDLSLAVNTIISSSHPNQKILDWQDPSGDGWNTYATASNFPTPASGDSFNRETERYCIKSPSLGGNTSYSNKIRIESDTLLGSLSPSQRNTIAAYDRAPIDSNMLGIFYSTADQINSDIFNYTGFFEIDDYIGDPTHLDQYNYPDLVKFANYYWKKYSNRNDLNAYIRIFSLFDFTLFTQIKQTLPARINARTGILIEPNALERSKVPTPANLQMVKGTFDPVTEKFSNKLLKRQILSYYNISVASEVKPTASINTEYTAPISSSNIYTVSSSYMPTYTCSLQTVHASSSKYLPVNLLYISSSDRSNELLISESISQGIIAPGTTELPMFIDQPITSSYSIRDPRIPVQLYITASRKSDIYQRIVHHYTPKDKVSVNYKLNSTSGVDNNILLDNTANAFNSIGLFKMPPSGSVNDLQSGSMFNPQTNIFSASFDASVNGGLFPSASYNFFTGPMMHFSSSTSASAVAAHGHAGMNGMEFVSIPSIVLGRKRKADDYDITYNMKSVENGKGDWSISYIAREDSGSVSAARFLIGSDPRPSISNPNRHPRIGFSDSNQFFFQSDYDGDNAAATGWGDRTDMHNYVITCTGATGSSDSMSIDLWVDGVQQLTNKLMAPATTSIETLGAGGYDSNKQFGFSGLLGQVRFYDGHILTDNEIYWLNLYPHLRANRDILPNANGQMNVNTAKRINADLFTSTSLEPADYYDDFPAAWTNVNYDGSRITGADFNINSDDTPDSGPVVSFTITNKEAILAQPKSDRLLKIGRKIGGFFKRNS